MSIELDNVNTKRRKLLVATASVVGVASLGSAAVELFMGRNPLTDTASQLPTLAVDLSNLSAGEIMAADWNGKPIYILRRTAEMFHTLTKNNYQLKDPNSDNAKQQPPYAKNLFRSIQPLYLVVVGLCTYAGCGPIARLHQGEDQLGSSWPGGFYCPCHGSKFDLSGRVFKNTPAPTNLKVPPYHFLSPSKLLIGAGPSND